MAGIARAIEKCLFKKQAESISHLDYGQPELDADGFPAEEQKLSVDPLTGMWIAPKGSVPEPESYYFYDSGWAKGCHYPEEQVSWETVDWQCSYCGSLHPLTEYRCANCGAVRTREY